MTLSRGKEQTGRQQLYWVADNVIADDFPDVNTALRDPDGLLAIGGDLETARLLDAYRRGIFPWYSEGQPILWWSPDPRCVLEPRKVKISRSLCKTLRKQPYRVTFNQAFTRVLRGCAGPRGGSTETWITGAMARAYIALFEQGYGLSVECWHGDSLAGGLYGVVIGRIFFGESMFSAMPDASKVALVHLARELDRREFRLIDCQVHSRHLQSLGAVPIPRKLFVNIVRNDSRKEPCGDWPVESEWEPA